MGIIQVLPEKIANRIAAGEVVERPASIVKELVENSLDAGATKIEVLIRHGGKSLIRVSDNGSGMSAADAEIAFQRHATSKVTDFKDLDRIDSYGFRGEALPSIGAVSRMQLTTRASGADTGTEIIVEGGKLQGAKEGPAAVGTTVEVRDLFFNTPGRRKFLKADTTESGHISDLLSNLAFSRLDVHWVYKNNEKTIFDLLSVSKPLERAQALLGKETAGKLIEINGENHGIRIHGLIGKPSLARSNRYGQSFFVNQRWIRSIGLSYALQGGYHGLLMQGQYPVAVLFIECDLERVDVNVHPTKMEVRISNEPQLKAFLKRLVEEYLMRDSDLAPSVSVRQSKLPSEVGSKTSAKTPLPDFLTPSKTDRPKGEESEQEKFSEEVMKPAPVAAQVATEPLESSIAIREKLKITKILGQIHHTFIIVESEEGLMIVDQHAAHERIQYEVLVRAFEGGQTARQNLLIEEMLEVTDRQMELMEESLPLLRKLGFEIDRFGDQTFVIRAVPPVIAGEDAATLIKGFLEEREEGKIKANLEDCREEIAAMIACKRKSVKAHDVMTAEAMKTMIEQLSGCANPFNCPHGRPTILKYSFAELERQFKRKL